MKGSWAWFGTAFLLQALAGGAELAAAEQSPGVLVLRNGNVVEGSVQQAGAYYRVDTANASLQIPTDQVEMLCANLDEAFELRRRTRSGSTADSHLELARWCLRHDLLDHASRELQEARATDARHPDLAAVELQIRQLRELDAPRRGARSETSPARDGAPTPSKRLPAAPFEISGEAQAQFVRNIQPMLIHTCATGGCHLPGGAQRFEIDRWVLVGNGNAKLVRRNLAATLHEVMKDNPSSSPLVARATIAHGAREGAASRPLDARQTRILREWLDEACGVKPVEPEQAASDGAPENSPTGTPLPTPGASAAAPAFVPRDAFDAEIFNRRHAAPATDATADSQPAAE
jgi:hypothetical protein